jgi:enoyl-CoA hydratase
LDYSKFGSMTFELREHGVLLMTIQPTEKKNAMTPKLHTDLGQVWAELERDRTVRVAVITGAGDTFCAGGELNWVKELAGKPTTAEGRADFSDFHELMAIPHGMARFTKPIISAINGPAVAGGLAVALMADISVAAEDAFICDGHVRGGIAAGDHSAFIWPLLTSMAKCKLYLMTGRGLSGAEAERIGLVSMAVPKDKVLAEALKIANELAAGPQVAVRWTKRALNGWLRQAEPIFEHSAALERLSFNHPDMAEGLAAILERRKPVFPSTQKDWE